MFFFFFNDTATTEIYTLSLHDALPICTAAGAAPAFRRCAAAGCRRRLFTRDLGEVLRTRGTSAARHPVDRDRKSTRLNSSHSQISYAVFCLKKKKHHTIRALRQQTNSR